MSWRRLGVDVLCGLCGRTLRPGTMLQTLTLPGLARPKYRCATCATEPAPATLDETTTPPDPITPDGRQHRLFSTRDLARDFKQKQAGD